MARQATKRTRTHRRTKPNADYRVFVSHATADKWIARVICDKLEATGVGTFRDDRDIRGGDDIPDEIRQQIKKCREFLVLLTPASVDRPWVQTEVGAAWGWSKNCRITALLCHVDTAHIPAMIRSKKVMPLNDADQFVAEAAERATRYKGTARR